MKDPLTPYEDIEVQLTALLLGELGEEEARELEARLAVDPALQALHLELKASVKLMQEAAQVGLWATSVDEKSPLQLSVDRRKTLFESFRKAESGSDHSRSKVVRGIPWYMPMGIAAALIALMCVTSLLLNTPSALESVRSERASIERMRDLSEEGASSQTTELFSNAPVSVSSGKDHKEPATDYFYLTPKTPASDRTANARTSQDVETLNRPGELPAAGPASRVVDNTTAGRRVGLLVPASDSASELALQRESIVDFGLERFRGSSRAEKENPRVLMKKQIPGIQTEDKAQSQKLLPKSSSFANGIELPANSPMSSTLSKRPQLSAITDTISLERQVASPFEGQPAGEVLAEELGRSADLFVSGGAELANEEPAVRFDADQKAVSASTVQRFSDSQTWGFRSNLQQGELNADLEDEKLGIVRSLEEKAERGGQRHSFGIELADDTTSGYSVRPFDVPAQEGAFLEIAQDEYKNQDNTAYSMSDGGRGLGISGGLGEIEVLAETAENLFFNEAIVPTPKRRGGIRSPEENQEKLVGPQRGIALKQAKADDGLEPLYDSPLPPAPTAEPHGPKPNDPALPQLGKKLSSAKPQPGTNVEHRPEQDAKEEPISTFSLNVSDVSFKLAQAALDQGQLPAPESIRSEQFLNAFDYRDPAPYPGQAIGFNWEVARHPFAHHRDVLRLALKTAATGREAGRAMSLTLLLDNSGSMERSDRREILRQALNVLSQTLSEQDKISVVSFARTARLWVDGVPGGSPGSVLEPVEKLVPQGGTNLEEALKVAYEVAQNHFIQNGVNRVILLTDGAANLGNVDPETLKQKIEAERRRGVAFDCFGIGWDGLNDPMLESLSRNGDGRYAFLNDPAVAGHEFADRLAGALNVAASDVKVQVEFNADRVGNWRQLGYAKHQLTKEQFRDNTVDAAEMAASEAGNALYVIEPKEDGAGPIGVVRVRFREPHTNQYHEKEWTVPYRRSIPEASDSSPSMKLAMTSSLFAEWLNGNPHAGNISIRDLRKILDGVPEIYGKDPRPPTLDRMLEQARQISGP